MAFDTTTRNKLAKLVADARELLGKEFTGQLQEIYGIQPGGMVSAIDKLGYLDDEQREIARLLRERISHLAADDPDDKKKVRAAIERMTREQSFTVLNRFAALRMCEERGLVQECVGSGMQSKGFKVYLQIAGTDLGNQYARYRTFIHCVYDEIAVDLGVLFDRFSLMGLLFPRETALSGLLVILNQPELKHIWAEDETIGWVYQYFNTKAEREAMRKASRSPRNNREMAVRNQFFTPRYVVEFLTDNTLGRIWYEMCGGDTVLKDDCRYLVRRPNEVFLAVGEKVPAEPEDRPALSQEELLKQTVYVEHRPKKDPRNLRVLDPACGSGHFLLYAFDLLERMYEEAWSDPESPKCEITGQTLPEDFKTLDDLRREVPKLIMEYNLHGIDIDPRAVQIAALALWLRAQKAWKNLGVKPTERPRVAKSNIVTAEPMPGESDMKEEFIAGLKPRVLGQLVDAVFEKMKLAGEAGALLKIEEEIKDVVSEAKKQWLQCSKPEQQFLFPGMDEKKRKQQKIKFDFKEVTDKGFWEKAEDRILDALKKYSEEAENGHTVIRRLFVDDAAQGFAFINLCRNRYDVILMNPPFGASSQRSKKYIEQKYPDTKGDVLANFIERTLHLMVSQGRIGAISNRTPFFLGSFDKLRTEILGKMGHIRLMADLGEGVLEAMVETVMYVITSSRRGEPESLFFRLLIHPNKSEYLQKLIDECFDGNKSDWTFVINPMHFKILDGSPYAYWVSKSTIEAVGNHPCIEGNKAAIRVGLQTGDDFRYLRLFWEIPNYLIVPCLQSKLSPNQTIRQLCIKQLKEQGFWVPFSKTDIASPWFSPITLLVNWKNDGYELKNFTNSKGKLRSRPQNAGFYFKPGFSYMGRSTRLVPYLVPAGVMPTARRAQIFPNQGHEYNVLSLCASNVGSAVARFRGEKFTWPNFQAGMVQGLPSCDFPKETLAIVKDHIDSEVNKRRAVVKRYEPYQEFSLPAWIHSIEEGETAWDLLSLFGRSLEKKIGEAFGLNTDQLFELERDIREAVSIRGASEDNEPEDAGEDSEDNEQELSVELITETPEEKAIGLLMYALGVAFGRWDVRFAIDSSLIPKMPDPFEPLPVCPPGMLVGPDRLPAEPNQIVSEEWLRARPDVNTLPSEGTTRQPTISDNKYPIKITWNGILVDDAGPDNDQLHQVDIVRLIREGLHVICKDKAPDIEQEACDILGVSDLRTYFRKPSGFFQDHLKRYSKSRRKAPIYWPLSTRSGDYTLWIYYHRLTDQTLYTCVKDYVGPKIEDLTKDIERLQKDLGDGGNTKQRQQLEKMQDFRQELMDFKDELLRVAGLPYKPNVNDGVLITACPLWKLFQLKSWQKDLKACWDKLKADDYDWAHLAYTIWPERVKEKCRTDRSIAIAHDLEELCEVEVRAPKKKKSKMKTEEE